MVYRKVGRKTGSTTIGCDNHCLNACASLGTHKGITEANARFFPALIGVLTIPVFYMAIRRLLTPRIALLSALFVSCIAVASFWSQNARFYTLLLLFFTLAWIWFPYWLRREE